jgi:hypothetical protein
MNIRPWKLRVSLILAPASYTGSPVCSCAPSYGWSNRLLTVLVGAVPSVIGS